MCKTSIDFTLVSLSERRGRGGGHHHKAATHSSKPRYNDDTRSKADTGLWMLPTSPTPTPSLSCIISLESKPTNLPGQFVSGRLGRQRLNQPTWVKLLSKQKKILSRQTRVKTRDAVQTRLVFCFRLFLLLACYLLVLTINKKWPGLVFRFTRADFGFKWNAYLKSKQNCNFFAIFFTFGS